MSQSLIHKGLASIEYSRALECLTRQGHRVIQSSAETLEDSQRNKTHRLGEASSRANNV